MDTHRAATDLRLLQTMPYASASTLPVSDSMALPFRFRRGSCMVHRGPGFPSHPRLTGGGRASSAGSKYGVGLTTQTNAHASGQSAPAGWADAGRSPSSARATI